MDKVLCLVCSKEMENRDVLHKHLKTHKLPKREYYYKYYPRKDLYTGTSIELVGDLDTYLNKKFACRKNMMSWLRDQPKDNAIKIAIEALEERKNKKNLEFAPCETDNKTTYVPSIRFYQKYCDGGYDGICKSLGLKTRYNYQLPNQFTYLNHIAEVQIDTREQHPLDFSYTKQTVTNKKLDFGDYKLFNNQYEVYFERKSCADFVSTLSRHNFDRFKSEIERAKDSYLIVLVEDPLDVVSEFKTNYKAFAKSHVSPDYIFHNMRELTTTYKNLQFLFVERREAAVEAMNNIFNIANVYQQYDLQLCYDLGLL